MGQPDTDQNQRLKVFFSIIALMKTFGCSTCQTSSTDCVVVVDVVVVVEVVVPVVPEKSG